MLGKPFAMQCPAVASFDAVSDGGAAKHVGKVTMSDAWQPRLAVSFTFPLTCTLFEKLHVNEQEQTAAVVETLSTARGSVTFRAVAFSGPVPAWYNSPLAAASTASAWVPAALSSVPLDASV